MFEGKPIIGIAGGIGSGKSFIAHCFAEEGCHVIDSDAQVRMAYTDPVIRHTLAQWWGDEVFAADKSVNRSFIARRVFSNPEERVRLEHLLHPWVNAARERDMSQAARECFPIAFVWDTPLLFETGLSRLCDCVVFVDVPLEERMRRVAASRGWDADELSRRENLQWPLYKKREISDYVLSNTADAAPARDQVRELIPRILAQVARK